VDVRSDTEARVSITFDRNDKKDERDKYVVEAYVYGMATGKEVTVTVARKGSGSGSSSDGWDTGTVVAAMDYQKIYEFDNLGNQRLALDLRNLTMSAGGAVVAKVPDLSGVHSFGISMQALNEYITRDSSNADGYLELTNSNYRLRIPFRVMMRMSQSQENTLETLPDVAGYLLQNNLQLGNLWLRVTMEPQAGSTGSWRVSLALERQNGTVGSKLAEGQPQLLTLPVILSDLAYPLSIAAPGSEMWVPISESGLYNTAGNEKG
jgi:hypothetical protein